MTVHTATEWKTDGKYGWFTRTRNDTSGKGGGYEVRIKDPYKKGKEETHDG